MATVQTWRTPDGRWIVDQVTGEPGVTYRIWDEGELAAELNGGLDALEAWFAGAGVGLDQLEPAPDGWDPFCE